MFKTNRTCTGRRTCNFKSDNPILITPRTCSRKLRIYISLIINCSFVAFKNTTDPFITRGYYKTQQTALYRPGSTAFDIVSPTIVFPSRVDVRQAARHNTNAYNVCNMDYERRIHRVDLIGISVEKYTAR